MSMVAVVVVASEAAALKLLLLVVVVMMVGGGLEKEALHLEDFHREVKASPAWAVVVIHTQEVLGAALMVKDLVAKEVVVGGIDGVTEEEIIEITGRETGEQKYCGGVHQQPTGKIITFQMQTQESPLPLLLATMVPSVIAA
jgi:hypothetical protein